MNKFNITFNGNLGSTVLPTELTVENSPFRKAWTNFVRELDGLGCKIENAAIDHNGKHIALPAAVTAGAPGH